MSMYNPHRGIGPPPGNARLNELLDSIRAEFESQARASGEYEHSSTIPPNGMPVSRRLRLLLRAIETSKRSLTDLCIVGQQITEMQLVREKVYNMEQTHLALKQK
jgi:glucose repression regulatory protein TUP1